MAGPVGAALVSVCNSEHGPAVMLAREGIELESHINSHRVALSSREVANHRPIDCILTPAGLHPFPAASLPKKPAVFSVLAIERALGVVLLTQSSAQEQRAALNAAISILEGPHGG